MVEISCGNKWWKQVAETRWKQVVEISDGNQWWKQVVETSKGNECVVEIEDRRRFIYFVRKLVYHSRGRARYCYGS